MSFKMQYLNDLLDGVIKRNPNEPEFHQTVEEVLAWMQKEVNL